jgi:hypothetical protein
LTLQQILRAVGKACEADTLTEAEVEKLYQERDFFRKLGYAGIGKDVLAQRSRSQKRYDVALLGFGGRVRAIIEFKKTSVTDLGQFKDDLYEKYVRPHLAPFGVLTNGIQLLLYARVNGSFVKQIDCRLSEVSEAQSREINSCLQKRAVDLESLASVLEQLRRNRKEPLLISDTESEGAKVFFQVFQLRPGSAFGRLVETLRDLLPKSIVSSGFTRGSYEFWQKTYARRLNAKEVPDDWKVFLPGESAEQVGRFSFALETAYTIISRLMLAKAADDRGFPGVRFVPRMQESFSELSTRGRLRAEHYLEVISRSFQRAGEVLFHSIFLQDIFDWWFELPAKEERPFLLALGEAMLMVTQFDFADLSGDLLGELYQRYFDKDTRKALGEFYTPAEVIELILDQCGYKGKGGDRLLDPPCGSGSFLVSALKRYLKQRTGADPKSVLLDLTEGLRIVGFDINPFAVLMAQVNYAALILPLYAEASHADRDFHILRLPVFRTDSLRIEEREEEAGGETPGLNLSLQFEADTLNLNIYLPIAHPGSKKRFLEMEVQVPRYQEARLRKLVGSLEDYVAALARVFQAARDKRSPLEALLKSRFGERASKLATYLEKTLDGLNRTVSELQGKYNDGRFLKTIEDLVLAVSLKHDLQYEFVVGNPPYVRIQKIPKHVKEDWEGKYEWTEGNYDLYVPFFERTVRSAVRGGWLAPGGRLGFIVSDRFLNVDYAQRLREELPRFLRVELLIDFRDTRVFADALNYPAILIGERSGGGTERELEAARVFASDTGFAALLEEFTALRRKVGPGKAERGGAAELFRFPRSRLVSEGWWLMPQDEAAVFDKLRAGRGARLKDLSASASAAFQGYSTSADDYFVFTEIEDLGELLRLQPQHEGRCCGRTLELEKAALRPFLFGRDVARWSVDWKRSWVFFPYAIYAKKETLFGEAAIVEDWNLIPSKENIGKFDFVDPDAIQKIEDRFPNVWKYLKNHEAELRKRENGKYKEGSSRGAYWYEATYPRGLKFYFRPKLVLQVLSRRPSFTLDLEGKFVFTAGGTAGVYGIALKNTNRKHALSLAAILNSRAADFCVKQISSVFGSRFYSYGDQFIEKLVVPTEVPAFALLPDHSARLLELASERKELERKISGFPETFEGELVEFELQTVKNLLVKGPRAEQLGVDPWAIVVERLLYTWAARYDSQPPFEFEDKAHAECLAEAMRSRDRKSLRVDEVLEWRLPLKPSGCKRLLELLIQSRQEARTIEAKIGEEEEELDELVCELYGISPTERRVIDGFLERYTSFGAAVEAPEDEGTLDPAQAQASASDIEERD